MGRGQMAHLILKLTRSQPYKWNLLWNLVEFPSLWIQNCCCHDFKFSSYALFFFHGDCVQMIYFLAWSHENYSTLHEKYLWHGIFFSCTKREYIPMWFFSCDLRTHTLTCIFNFNDISGFYMNKKQWIIVKLEVKDFTRMTYTMKMCWNTEQLWNMISRVICWICRLNKHTSTTGIDSLHVFLLVSTCM